MQRHDRVGSTSPADLSHAIDSRLGDRRHDAFTKFGNGAWDRSAVTPPTLLVSDAVAGEAEDVSC